jgi:hypothetical protein
MTASAPQPDAPFSTRAVAMIIAAAVVAFAAFLLLVAFAPDFRSGHDGRAHALSTSGTGYAGLVKLTDALGSHALIARETALLGTPSLLLVTPEADGNAAALDRLIHQHPGPTLIVLPKWRTRPLPSHASWAQTIGMDMPISNAAALHRVASGMALAQSPFAGTPHIWPGDVPRLARAQIGPQKDQQRLTGQGFTPLLLDRDGRVVLAQITGTRVYVLAEPDLLNNQGLADRWTARQGWQVIDDLMPTNELAFDLTTNGFGHQKSPLQLLFKPPFLPVTLCIVMAGLLAGLHGAIRFGGPQAPGRAIAFGKRTLVDNAAQLFRAARKEHRVGRAYAALTRDLAAQATAAPARLSGEALDHYLDHAGRDAGDPPYATLAWHAEMAEDRDQLLGAARALYRWRRNRMR